MKLKPKKGKYGYLQGTCSKCGEDDLPLIRFKTNSGNEEVVCDTCANLLRRSEQAKLKIKQVDRDKEFIDQAING